MIKKIVIALVVVALVASAIVYFNRSNKLTTLSEDLISANDFPPYNPFPLKLLSLDSTVFQLTEPYLRQPLVAILFNPTCEHCQHQAEELNRHLDLLKNVTLIMVASATLKEIGDFSVNYKLSNMDNIFFAKANPVDVYNNFGSISVPYILVYGKNHKLIRDFRGNVEVEELVQYLR
jgi:hypothetical protein